MALKYCQAMASDMTLVLPEPVAILVAKRAKSSSAESGELLIRADVLLVELAARADALDLVDVDLRLDGVALGAVIGEGAPIQQAVVVREPPRQQPPGDIRRAGVVRLAPRRHLLAQQWHARRRLEILFDLEEGQLAVRGFLRHGGYFLCGACGGAAAQATVTVSVLVVSLPRMSITLTTTV